MIITDQLRYEEQDLRAKVINTFTSRHELEPYDLWKPISTDEEFHQQLTFLTSVFSDLEANVIDLETEFEDQTKRTQYIDTLKSYDTYLADIIDWSNSNISLDPYDLSIRPVIRTLDVVEGDWLASGIVSFEDEMTLIGSSLTSITFRSAVANYLGFYISNVDFVIINGDRIEINRGLSLDFNETITIEIPSEFLNRSITLENIIFAKAAYETTSVIQTKQLNEVYRVPNSITVPNVQNVVWEFSTDGSTWHETSALIKDGSDNPFVHQIGEHGSSIVLSTTSAVGGDPISSSLNLSSGYQVPVNGEYAISHWILPETVNVYRDIDKWLITDTHIDGFDINIQSIAGYYFTVGKIRVPKTEEELLTDDPTYRSFVNELAKNNTRIDEMNTILAGAAYSATHSPQIIRYYEFKVSRFDEWLRIVKLPATANTHSGRGVPTATGGARVRYLRDWPWHDDSYLSLEQNSTPDAFKKTIIEWDDMERDKKIWLIEAIRGTFAARVINLGNDLAADTNRYHNTVESIERKETHNEQLIEQIINIRSRASKHVVFPLDVGMFNRMLLGNETDNLEEDTNLINSILDVSGVHLREPGDVSKYIRYMNGQYLLDQQQYEAFETAQKILIQHFKNFGGIAVEDATISSFAESIGKIQTNIYASRDTTIAIAIGSNLFKSNIDVLNVKHGNTTLSLTPSTSQIDNDVLYHIYNIEIKKGRNFLFFLSSQVAKHQVVDHLDIKIVEEAVFYPFAMERAGLVSTPYPMARGLDYKTWKNYTEERRKFEVVGVENHYNHISSAWESKIHVASPLGHPYKDAAMYLEYNYRNDSPSDISATSANYYIRGSMTSLPNISTKIRNFNIKFGF